MGGVAMTTVAPHLQAFFTDRLMQQRQASPHTVSAYRDTFRLLLDFTQRILGKAPSKLDLQDIDAALIGKFLNDLEEHRGNSIRTRNARLAAVHSFFRYVALREPGHSELIQRVLAIPRKRFDRAIVTFLSRSEAEALLETTNGGTFLNRRDHALMLLAIQTGLRVSELTQLNCQDVQLGSGAHVRCMGKGRKERCTPLTAQCVKVLQLWLCERNGADKDPLFLTRTGGRLSRDAVEHLVSKAARLAREHCPSLRNKRVSPHVLRHTCAMQLLNAGIDRAVIALWLGHESVDTTQIYLHADLAMKERAIALTAPIGSTTGRYRPADSLLTFLEGL